MIIGLAIKNYKTYKSLQYIPVSNGSSFSSFLGPNGIGKTSIFEALDIFFNGGEWIINNTSKKNPEDAFIAPLLLISIKDINLNKKERKIVALISDYFWNYDLNSYGTFTDKFKESIAHIRTTGASKETHYLFMIGVKNRTNEIHIPHFENDIKEILSQDIDTSFSELDSILKKVKGHYRYIHLPAEADSLDFTKMESTYVQKLLDEDIRKKIKQSISESSINEINKELKSFIEDINNSLEKYTYKGKNKDRLTSNDLIDRIFSAYFGIKVLHKKNSNAETIIKDLSSGEKKQALIDLSYALISRFNKRDYQIVLAIDEPDASINARCRMS